MNDIHIGKMIKDVFTQSGMSISDFAKAIHSSRTNIYDIFSRENIDIELLLRISEVLEYDFLGDIYTQIHPSSPKAKKEYFYVAKKVTSEELEELKKKEDDLVVFKSID